MGCRSNGKCMKGLFQICETDVELSSILCELKYYNLSHLLRQVITAPNATEWIKFTGGVVVSYHCPFQYFPLSTGHHWAHLSGRRFCKVGTSRLLCHTALVVTATHVAHPCPFAATGTALWCRRERLRAWEATGCHTNSRCDRTNLRPGTKPPLGFVALVGGDFGPWGNRVAAGTLGQFTVLWKGGHIHPFMQWLTKWIYCNNICPWPQNAMNIRDSFSDMGQSFTT